MRKALILLLLLCLIWQNIISQKKMSKELEDSLLKELLSRIERQDKFNVIGCTIDEFFLNGKSAIQKKIAVEFFNEKEKKYDLMVFISSKAFYNIRECYNLEAESVLIADRVKKIDVFLKVNNSQPINNALNINAKKKFWTACGITD